MSAPRLAVTDARAGMLQRALWLEYLTVGWNVIEGIIAVAAAVAAGSVALLGSLSDLRSQGHRGTTAQSVNKCTSKGGLRLDVHKGDLKTGRDRVCRERPDKDAARLEPSARKPHRDIRADAESQLYGDVRMRRILIARSDVGRPKIAERQAPVPHPNLGSGNVSSERMQALSQLTNPRLDEEGRMGTERLSMRTIRDILRQRCVLGCAHRAVARSAGRSVGAVHDTERRKAGVTLELLHLEYLERDPDGYLDRRARGF